MGILNKNSEGKPGGKNGIRITLGISEILQVLIRV